MSGLFYHVTFSVLADKIRHFQAVQRRDGSVDLRLVPNRAYDDSVLEIVKKSSASFCRASMSGSSLVLRARTANFEP